jgi:hypothetical protein
MLPIKETKEGIVFSVQVLPRSSRCELAGIHDKALKLKITAPPVEGLANEECIRFLSRFLGIAKAQVAIVGGHTSRKKRIAVSGLTKSDMETLISNYRNT